MQDILARGTFSFGHFDATSLVIPVMENEVRLKNGQTCLIHNKKSFKGRIKCPCGQDRMVPDQMFLYIP